MYCSTSKDKEKEKGFSINNSEEVIPEDIYYVPKTLGVSNQEKDRKLWLRECHADIKDAVKSIKYDPIEALAKLKRKQEILLQKSLKLENNMKKQLESSHNNTSDTIAESKDISTVVTTTHDTNMNDNINTNTTLMVIDNNSPSAEKTNLNRSNNFQKQGLLKPLSISDQNNFLPKARSSEHKFVENYQKTLRKVSPDELEKAINNLVTPKGLQKALKEKKGDQKVFYNYFIEEKLHN